ncbi:MAG: thioredoxin family protein [Desulfuromonas sp.]|nr:MAG: thioredoxin family protein [Desulfuromonas sp.]
MRIDILCKPDGNGRCQQTLENVREALMDLAIEAEVHVFRDKRKMIDHRAYLSPALVVDDNLRVCGRVPDPLEIRNMIRERPRYRKRFDEVA